MTFSRRVEERLLVTCHRHCCVCHKPCGIKMEIHHIVPKNQGGEDTEENAIPLCLDCHAEVAAYDVKHPKGKRFTPSELKKHKAQWFAICSQSPWQRLSPDQSDFSREPYEIEEDIFSTLRVDDSRPAQRLVGEISNRDKESKIAFVKRVLDALRSKDEELRWKAAHLVEELVLWEPRLISPDVLEQMSNDDFFSIRSSAAVCYYHLAVLDPSSIPINVLARLAGVGEDWYVMTPATSALLRLARSRPVAVDILARDLGHEDAGIRQHAADAIRRLAGRDWDLISEEIVAQMIDDSDSFVRKVGNMCAKKIREARKEPERDYALF